MKDRSLLLSATLLLLAALVLAGLWFLPADEGIGHVGVDEPDGVTESEQEGPVALAEDAAVRTDPNPAAALRSDQRTALGPESAQLDGLLVHLVSVFDNAPIPVPIEGATVEFWSIHDVLLFSAETDDQGHVLAPEALRAMEVDVVAGTLDWGLHDLRIPRLSASEVVSVFLVPLLFAGVEVVRTDGSVSPTPALDRYGIRSISLPSGVQYISAPNDVRPSSSSALEFDALERRALELAGLPEGIELPPLWYVVEKLHGVEQPAGAFTFETGYTDTPIGVHKAVPQRLSEVSWERVSVEPHSIEVGALTVVAILLGGNDELSRIESFSLWLQRERSDADRAGADYAMYFFGAELVVASVEADPTSETDGVRVEFEPFLVPLGLYDTGLWQLPVTSPSPNQPVDVVSDGVRVEFALEPTGSLELKGLVQPPNPERGSAVLMLLHIDPRGEFVSQLQRADFTGSLPRIPRGSVLAIGPTESGTDLFIASPEPPSKLVELAIMNRRDAWTVLQLLQLGFGDDADPWFGDLARSLAVPVEAGATATLYPSGLFGPQ